MRRFRIFSVLLVALTCSVGCDFVRTVAGRPTSAEIEAKKTVLEAARRDSAAAAALRDSIAAAAAFLEAVQETAPVAPAPKVVVRNWSDIVDGQLPCEYYVLVGVFSDRKNASNQASYARHCGFEPTLIYFKNGRVGVGVCGGDRAEAVSRLEEVVSQPFSPKDTFVLKTR